MSTLRINKLQGLDIASNVEMPAGHIVQVVHNVLNTTTNINSDSTSFVASGFSITVTPKKVGNIILVQYSTALFHKQVTSAAEVKLYLDGSQASGTASYWGGYVSADNNATDYSPRLGTYKYTAVDTNSHTFEPYFRSYNSNNVYFIHSDGSAIISATEIQT